MDLKETKKRIINALEEMSECCMCNRRAVNQDLGRTIEDETNEEDVRSQASLLIYLGFKKSDKFCQDCFWK